MVDGCGEDCFGCVDELLLVQSRASDAVGYSVGSVRLSLGLVRLDSTSRMILLFYRNPTDPPFAKVGC